jgi:hypothetical protein
VVEFSLSLAAAFTIWSASSLRTHIHEVHREATNKIILRNTEIQLSVL